MFQGSPWSNRPKSLFREIALISPTVSILSIIYVNGTTCALKRLLMPPSPHARQREYDRCMVEVLDFHGRGVVLPKEDSFFSHSKRFGNNRQGQWFSFTNKAPRRKNAGAPRLDSLSTLSACNTTRSGPRSMRTECKWFCRSPSFCRGWDR